MIDAQDDDNDINRVDKNTRLIGVIMPNDTTASEDNWWIYRKSVSDVEKLTGLTFFCNVPPEVIEPQKKKKDDVEDIPVFKRDHK